MMRVLTIVFGVLLVVGGFYCILTPVATYATLAWLIGALMIVEGAGGIVTWIERRDSGRANGWALAGGILSALLGVVLLGSYALQFAVDAFIAYFIAIWLVFAGVTRIALAVIARGSQGQAGARGWAIQLVLGVLIVILGALCIFNPLSVAVGVGLLLGMSIVFAGVDLVIGGLVI